MALIGITGRARSGKDTVGNILGQKGFHRYAFADALKRGCMEFFGFSYEQVYGDLKETTDTFWGFTPRWVLQYVGTELMRTHIDTNIWVKSLEAVLTHHGRFDIGQDVVVTDVRFNNEAEWIHNKGGTIVQVVRPAAPGIATADHASETGVSFDYIDRIIMNDGSLDELRMAVYGIPEIPS
jgi:hypothetical protein